ncbi:hypothetical protein M409DRAFT_64357 [Zasmidium cellare ATCC 36951]|uniref:Cytochrome b561 domain-containing protein n=1 Tax=Zasmidium cellare ATCC 36951 TaxID=1080233 RepID=A0A6A6CS11_ZASCE|nr:uncharacterized protein M409DRAFT_64357 [Zasmidium cellare ATCC 36951]KAF2169944.1 hypothetical protein M409DRAFT_64357 [Zasmidium cellare ATCC 36951]
MATLQARRMTPITAAMILSCASIALGQDGHDQTPEGEARSDAPLHSTMWIHILLQGFACGMLYPTGMVLGLVRSRWHVPVQVVATTLAIVGYSLGYLHKGAHFGPNAHAKFATPLMLMMIVQSGVGIYLKIHIGTGFLNAIRRQLVRGHGILGAIMPIAIWAQFLLGGIASQGFCRNDHLGQCAAHFIMGSAFIAYGIMLTIILLNGQAWLAGTRRSQEFWDSLIITLWGFVNTFTEHRWGHPWAKNDLDHTSIGILWFAAGLVGMWLSRDRQGRPQRNLIPAVVIILTGWAMGAHPQDLMMSRLVHSTFGYILMSAGGARIIEIAFVLKARTTPIDLEGGHTEINSFQYLPPFLLCAAGFLLMGATEEQMKALSDAGVPPVSYILVLSSGSFFLFLFVLILLHLYSTNKNSSNTGKQPVDLIDDLPRTTGYATTSSSADHQAAKAEDFELHGLMSNDE